MKLNELIWRFGFTKIVDTDLDFVIYERQVKGLTFVAAPMDKRTWKGNDDDKDADVVVFIYETDEQVVITDLADLSTMLHIISKSDRLTEVLR